jgi:peptide/nickel transport system ATP-binding protein
MEETRKSKTILEVRDLNVVYETDLETVYAVNGVSFTVKEGETLGLVGETGAGKSTTALSILRLLAENTGKIREGSILFDGEDILEMDNLALQKLRGEDISMIFQDPMTSLNPVLTVGYQIAEVLELHNHDHRSAKEIDQKVEEMLRLVGIPPERKHEYPHQFSGGMKQRVVIAIALACEPRLLIADEPTTALDVTIQAQVIDMMEKLKDRLNTSMILITHDLGIVAEICDQVAIMYAGEIIERGTVYDIFESQRHHPYTEGLFGSIPRLDDETERLKPIKGLMPDPTDLPKGCKFSPRCPQCMDICREKRPPVCRYGSHEISCHLFGQSQGHEGRDEA